MRLVPRFVLENITVHYVSDTAIWGANGYRLFKGDTDGQAWQELGHIPVRSWRRLFARFSLLRRLLRLGIHHIVAKSDRDLLILVDKRIYRSSDGGETFALVHTLRRGRRPLRRGWCMTQDGRFLYGEYFGNPEREEVLIWCSPDFGTSWEVMYRFSPSAIRHIHAVQQDPFSGDIWIATGDLDPECKVLRCNSSLDDCRIVGEGEQKWRAVSFIFHPDYVFWGTDTPKEPSKLIRWCRETCSPQVVAWVDGPVYYSVQTKKGGLLFGTTVERRSGEMNNRACVWGSYDGFNWEELWSVRKDRWNNRLFGHGVLSFPATTKPFDDDAVWVVGQAVDGLDSASACMRLAGEAQVAES